MKRVLAALRVMALLGGMAFLAPAHSAVAPVTPSAPGVSAEKSVNPALQTVPVEVVFCLDTTGSMGRLIDGAKAKIWSICNQIATGKPTPQLKVGLVAYRDRGDDYVTKVFDLTDDLDAVHKNLKTFTAGGGGDLPESVNQALFDSVHKIGWSKDAKTLRIIFLVGDAPPHMDYPNDVHYPVTCQEAAKRGILINTIQCGKDAACQKYWRDICLKAEGSYVQIAQDGAVRVVSTPFDKRLSEINSELARSTIVYGDERSQNIGLLKNAEAAKLESTSAASRIAYQARNNQVASYDLLDCIRKGKVQLEKLKPEELPVEMRKMNLREQKEHLEKIEQRRQSLQKEVLELDNRRNAYVKEKEAEDAKKGLGSFDRQVQELLSRQAKNFGLTY